jgi:hypothetical protein
MPAWMAWACARSSPLKLTDFATSWLSVLRLPPP